MRKKSRKIRDQPQQSAGISKRDYGETLHILQIELHDARTAVGQQLLCYMSWQSNVCHSFLGLSPEQRHRADED